MMDDPSKRYDFLIDCYLRPWLVEINAGPSMNLKTSVKQKLVPMMCEDLLKGLVGGM